MNNLKQKGFNAFIWDFTGQIAGQLVGFVISIILARLLSPGDFGLLAMVNVIVGISSVFMDVGLGGALIQRKEVSDEHYGTVFFFNITIGLLLATLLFSFSGSIASFYHNFTIVNIAKVMSLLFIINSFGNVIRVKLRKEFQNKIITQSQFFSAVISGTIGIILAFKGFGVWSLITQSLSNALLTNLFIFYRVSWRPKIIFKKKSLIELWQYGFRMFLSGLLDRLFTNLDSIIIGKLFSPKTLGYYFRSKSLNNIIIQYSSGSLMQVMFPLLSVIQDDKEKVRMVVTKGLNVICFMAFFFVGFFYVTGGDIILILFGEKWKPAIPMFQIVMLSAYDFPLSSLFINILSSAGNSKAFLRLEIYKKLTLALSFIFGFYFGIEGFLYALAVNSFFSVWIDIIFGAKQLNVSQFYFIKKIIPYVITCVSITFLLSLISNLFILNKFIHLSIFGFIFIAAYATMMFSFKIDGAIIFKEELSEIIKRKLSKKNN